MHKLDGLVGLQGISAAEAETLPAWAKFWEALSDDLNAPRAKARADKQWAKSDELRDALKAKGILVKDTKDGQGWQKI